MEITSPDQIKGTKAKIISQIVKIKSANGMKGWELILAEMVLESLIKKELQERLFELLNEGAAA